MSIPANHSEQWDFQKGLEKKVCSDTVCISPRYCTECLGIVTAGYQHHTEGPTLLLGVAVVQSWHDAKELTEERIADARKRWMELTEGNYGEGRLWFLGHIT
jgi:hypothetical protein